VGRILDYLKGADLVDSEARTLTRSTERAPLLPTVYSAPLEVNTPAAALRVSDAYACVRLLADSVASLPPKVYRRTEAGRVPAGDDQRLVQLLRQPSPGSTSADLFSQLMVSLNTTGNAYVAKYRSEGTIVSLGLIPSDQVEAELRGQRVVYTLTLGGRRSEHSVDDIVHVKAMSADGLTGLSPVAQCRLALGLSASLQASAKSYFQQGSKPSGIISAPSPNTGELERLAQQWADCHAGVDNFHKVAVVAGEIGFTPLAFSADDSQFLQQRELSTREVARIFRVPAWAIDGASGDSMTYANVTEQNRSFASHSLTPWLVRIERAFSNDSDLCPGGAYLSFDLDGLLRADAATRAQVYTAALNPETGWLTRAEVRELEDLAPEVQADD
jgi:HK97 family phage portal protein